MSSHERSLNKSEYKSQKSHVKSKSNITFKSIKLYEDYTISAFIGEFKVAGGKSAPNFYERGRIYYNFGMSDDRVNFDHSNNCTLINTNNNRNRSGNKYGTIYPNPSPFYKKKTLTILTETSEFSEIINPNLYFFTPKESVNTFSLSNQKNSFFISTTGFSSSSSMNLREYREHRSKFTQQYEYDNFDQVNYKIQGLNWSTKSNNNLYGPYPPLSDRSVQSKQSFCSKSTLKKAEEFLDCLKSQEIESIIKDNNNKDESNKENEADQIMNGTLGCYLVTDHSPVNTKREINPEVNINNNANKIVNWNFESTVSKAESFQIINNNVDSRNNYDKRSQTRENISKPLAMIILSLMIVIGVIINTIAKSRLNRIECLDLYKTPNTKTISNSNSKSDNSKSLIPQIHTENKIIPVKTNKYEVVYHRRLLDLLLTN